VIPLDAWYIIPAEEVVPVTVAALFPHVQGSWGKYERFREAWHLLTGGKKPKAANHPALRPSNPLL